MTLKEFREQTEDLPEDTVLIEVSEESGNYYQIYSIIIEKHIKYKTLGTYKEADIAIII